MNNQFTLVFSAQEKEELLEIFKNHPKWQEKIKNSSNSFVWENIITYQGCADRGFCFKCNIFLADTLCFCGGGFCPKCGGYVAM